MAWLALIGDTSQWQLFSGFDLVLPDHLPQTVKCHSFPDFRQVPQSVHSDDIMHHIFKKLINKWISFSLAGRRPSKPDPLPFSS